MDNIDMIIESILFTSGDAIPLEKFSKLFDISDDILKNIILSLSDKYQKENRGYLILEVNNSYQMCTNPTYYEYVKKFYKLPQKNSLSQSMLETLSIICYKQPITKSQIDDIRGVNSDYSINKLLEYELISEKNRLNTPGKPILFETTDNFLKYFNLKNIYDLPNFDKII